MLVGNEPVVASKDRWLFALSIDEEMSWSARRIDDADDYQSGDQNELTGSVSSIPHKGKLTDFVRDLLSDISKKMPGLFPRVVSVGVSSIGVVIPEQRRVTNVDRKAWNPEIDFGKVLPAFFSDEKLLVSVQNDAVAKCLAEYHWRYRPAHKNGPEDAPPDWVFYASFHDGVNGAFAGGHGAFNRAADVFGSAELGHVLAYPHPRDAGLVPYSACADHHYCYAGLAAGARLRNQWGKATGEKTAEGILRRLTESYDESGDHPLDMLAHYLANFCWMAVLHPVRRPRQIYVGGAAVNEKVIELARERFAELNVHGAGRYVDYDDIGRDDFISLAFHSPVDGALKGALELARQAERSRVKPMVRPKKEKGV